MKEEIIIDGAGSDWFEKAIFVLKAKNQDKLPKDLFVYAEELVEAHLKKVPSKLNDEFKGSLVGEEALKNMKFKKECQELKREKRKLEKRAKYITSFFYIAIVTCVMSLIILFLSSFS